MTTFLRAVRVVISWLGDGSLSVDTVSDFPNTVVTHSDVSDEVGDDVLRGGSGDDLLYGGLW